MGLFGPPNTEKMKAKRDIQGLIDALDYQKDFSVRQTAAAALGQIGDGRAVGPLIAALEDQDWRVCLFAAKALGQISDAQAVEPLITALNHKDEPVRTAAVEALGQIGDPRAAEPLITTLLNSFINQVSLDIIADALGKIRDWASGQDDGESALQELICCMGVKDEGVSRTFQRALVMAGEYAVLPLIDALHSDKWRARQAAASALGQIGDKRAVEPLINTLKDEVQDVRSAAATGLQLLGWRAVPGESEISQRIADFEWDRVVEIGAPAVQSLIHVLKDKKLSVRMGAAQALGKICDPRAVEPLINALKDKSKEVRQVSAMALGQMGDPLTVKPLTVALGDENAQVRIAAAKALGQIGDERALVLLHTALGDKSKSVRRAAARALQQIGGFQALITVLNTNDHNLREAAVEGLDYLGWKPERGENGIAYWIAKGRWDKCIEIGVSAVEPLGVVLRDSDAKLRRAAAEALGKIGEPRAVKTLIAALNDNDRYVRNAIAEALGQIGDAYTVEPLIAALSHGYPLAREAAAKALGQIEDTRAVEPLIAALSHEYPHVREAAAEALGQIGDARAVEPLITALGESNMDINMRRAAARGLVAIYKSAKSKDSQAKLSILTLRQKILLPHTDSTTHVNHDCLDSHFDYRSHEDKGIGVDFPL